MPDINRDLSVCFGVPVEFDRKIDGLRRIAQALSRRDLMHAQIATLHLQIPDPPALPRSEQAPGEIVQVARQLHASELLKADWDPAKHPRWPAGSPGGIGGEFAPAGTASDDSTDVGQNALVIPAQITIPVPFELPGVPFPSEILPPPVIPNINPRDLPRNPYPDRPECEQEWAEATSFCLRLTATNQLGEAITAGWERHCLSALWVKYPKTVVETAQAHDAAARGNEHEQLVGQPDSFICDRAMEKGRQNHCCGL